MEILDGEIERAYQSWQQAISVFNSAETKEEITFAIFNMEAKKKHYLLLLNRARE